MSQNSTQRWFNLEERFFAEMDQQLLDKLKHEMSEKKSADAIMQVTGIGDSHLAEEIAALEITVETLSAFRLAPLVAVAWADDRVEEAERYAIIRAAEKSGLKADDVSMKLLDTWTRRRPGSELLDAWCDYAKALCASLGEQHRAALKKEVLAQVEAVAQASGGFLGFGSVSHGEKAVMKRIEQALS